MKNVGLMIRGEEGSRKSGFNFSSWKRVDNLYNFGITWVLKIVA